jgi:hypothetical protein
LIKSCASLLGFLLLFSYVGTAVAAPDTATVPGVSCPKAGEAGPVRSQTDQSLRNSLDPRAVAQIAYYSAPDIPGVYAPKGWNCTAWNGSYGRILLVTPKRMDAPYFPLPVVTGPAVMIQYTQGEGFGRFHVAVAAAQLFPLVGREFIRGVRQEHLISDSSFDAQRYPDDWIQYLSDRFIQYATPANRVGLGTQGLLETSELPVRGLAILNLQTDVILLTEVRVRLPPALSSVEDAIMQLETACVQRRGGC